MVLPTAADLRPTGGAEAAAVAGAILGPVAKHPPAKSTVGCRRHRRGRTVCALVNGGDAMVPKGR